jgi:CHAT domain-containing protein
MFDQSDCFQREAATESRVKLSGDRYHILHFATHGIYDAANPMYSGIVLSAGNKEDGFWSANEIANSKLNADLVVMSACETALGEVRPGEGILGLSWALFAAGSRSNLLSQWQVDDRSTTQLMKGFYQRIQTAAGSGKWALLGRAEALRKAQLELASSKQWAHPYFWSSFVLIGDWQ